MASTITLTARLLGPDGSPRSTPVVLSHVETDGDAKVLAKGKTDDDGRLKLAVDLPRGGKTILPQLTLSDADGNVLCVGGSYREGLLELGTLVVADKAWDKLGDAALVGIPEALAQQLSARDAQLTEAKAAIDKLAGALKESAEMVARLTAGLEASEARAKELEAKATELARQAEEAEARAAKAEGALSTLVGQVAAAEDRAAQAEAELAEATSTLKSTEEAHAATRTELEATSSKLAHTEETVSVYETGEAKLQYVVRAIGSQLDEARTELDSTGGRYKVNKVSATLKVVPDATGSLFTFPKPDAVVDTASLSELVIELEEGLPTKAPVVPEGLVVPDLSGLTRVAIERVLKAAQLTAAYVSETVADETQVGRCVRQLPAAGEPTSPGAVVAVYLGKQLHTGSEA